MKKTYLRTFIITLLFYPVFTQVSSGGEPKSLKLNLSSDVSNILLPPIDEKTLISEASIKFNLKFIRLFCIMENLLKKVVMISMENV